MLSLRGAAGALLAVVVAAGCTMGGNESDSDSGQSDEPLHGLYQFDYDGSKRTRYGAPAPRTDAASARWAFRSHCTDAGCVATGTRVSEDGSATDQRATLDLIDGKWVMVVRETGECGRGGPRLQMFGTWVVQPSPDGTLTGLYTDIRTGPDCPGGFQLVTQMPVTVTRQGDAPDNIPVDDPIGVTPRAPSQAEGFQGAYTRTESTRPDNGAPVVSTVHVMTYCIRNTDECVSTETKDGEDVATMTVLNFAADRWTASWEAVARECGPAGRRSRQLISEEVLLPPNLANPPPNPIPNLTGTVRSESMAPCLAEQLYDLRYQRADT